MDKVLTTSLDPVIPDITEWPIYKLSRGKDKFLGDVSHITEEKILSKIHTEKELADLLGKVLYSERIRLTQKPWKADPADEKEFWAGVKDELLRISHAQSDQTFEKGSPAHKLLRKIIDRYSKEIVGNFSPGVYNFAKNAIPIFISKILNASPSNKFRFWRNQKTLDERIKISGDIDKIRRLAKNNTIVAVPTHFSNLDSILIGYALERIGLPAFTYGAGLNLFSIGLLNYYMNNLGAYKVDRRKKNAIYLEVLKNYSTVSLIGGANGLFFPGGTRSRSGALEKSLKLGLLGTTIESQRHLIEAAGGKDYKKIFVMPCIFNYHFVLEANGLIEDYLRATGKDRYLRENDEYSTSYKIVKFIAKFLFANSEFYISYGPLMDVLGNLVDENGDSIDHLGRKVDLHEYFTLNGDFKIDLQRENEYTRMLERAIVEKFHTHNTMLSSHIVAFTAFRLMRKKFSQLDLYAFLRLPNEDVELPYHDFSEALERVRMQAFELEKEGKIRLTDEIRLPIRELIDHGIANMGIYHTQKVLRLNSAGNIISEDKKLLFYYHNRSEGYNLEAYV